MISINSEVSGCLILETNRIVFAITTRSDYIYHLPTVFSNMQINAAM